MKTWKWRSVRKITKGTIQSGVAFDSGLLQIRVYPKGFMSYTHKFYNLSFQAKTNPEKSKWITCQGFSLSGVFKELKKEIAENNWNILD